MQLTLKHTRTALLAIAALLAPGLAAAQGKAAVAPGLDGTRIIATPFGFDDAVTRLEQAIASNGMGLVASASASRAAASRGVKIPGNAVLMVFRNDYAVRMLEASVPAGIEAPLRLYVTETPSGKADISYRTPSAVFAPWRNDKLEALAHELNPVIERIVTEAARP